MAETEKAEDWALVKDAAEIVDRQVNQVYKWLRKDQAETHIRRRRIKAKMFVHIPTLLEYEATVTAGRPREN